RAWLMKRKQRIRRIKRAATDCTAGTSGAIRGCVFLRLSPRKRALFKKPREYFLLGAGRE
ncbi:MAG: hypothetical protein RSD27_05200, partial [Ruthenibacterium sp.]